MGWRQTQTLTRFAQLQALRYGMVARRVKGLPQIFLASSRVSSRATNLCLGLSAVDVVLHRVVAAIGIEARGACGCKTTPSGCAISDYGVQLSPNLRVLCF